MCARSSLLLAIFASKYAVLLYQLYNYDTLLDMDTYKKYDACRNRLENNVISFHKIVLL